MTHRHVTTFVMNSLMLLVQSPPQFRYSNVRNQSINQDDQKQNRKRHIAALDVDMTGDLPRLLKLPTSIMDVLYFDRYIYQIDRKTYSELMEGSSETEESNGNITLIDGNDYYILSCMLFNHNMIPSLNHNVYNAVMSYLRLHCPLTEMLLRIDEMALIAESGIGEHISSMVTGLSLVRSKYVISPKSSTILTMYKSDRNEDDNGFNARIGSSLDRLVKCYMSVLCRNLTPIPTITIPEDVDDIESNSLLTIINDYPAALSPDQIMNAILDLGLTLKLRDVLSSEGHSSLYVDSNGRLLHLERLDVNNPQAKVTNDSPYVLPCDCTGYNSEQLDELLDQVITGDYSASARSKSWIRELSPNVIIYGRLPSKIISYVTQKSCTNFEQWIDTQCPSVTMNRFSGRTSTMCLAYMILLNYFPEKVSCEWSNDYRRLTLNTRDEVRMPRGDMYPIHLPNEGIMYNRYSYDLVSLGSLTLDNSMKPTVSLCVNVEGLSHDDALERFNAEVEKIYEKVRKYRPGCTISQHEDRTASGKPYYVIRPSSLVDSYQGHTTITIYMGNMRDLIIGNLPISSLWRDHEGWHATASCLRAHMTRRWDWRHEIVGNWVDNSIVEYLNGYIPNDELLNRTLSRNYNNNIAVKNYTGHITSMVKTALLHTDCRIIYHLLKANYRKSLQGDTNVPVSIGLPWPWSLSDEERNVTKETTFNPVTDYGETITINNNNPLLREYIDKFGDYITEHDAQEYFNDYCNSVNGDEMNQMNEGSEILVESMENYLYVGMR